MSEIYLFNKNAVSAIFDEYAPLIYKYVGRFCHDFQETDRITGDVFTLYLEKTSLRKRPPSDPRITLYRIAYDALVKHLHVGGQVLPAFIASLPSREAEQEIRKATLSATDKNLTDE